MALLHSATGWWIDEAGAPDPRPPLARLRRGRLRRHRRRLPRDVDRLAPARARARRRRRAARGRTLRARAERPQRRLRQRLLGPRARAGGASAPTRAVRRARARPTSRSARSASSAGARRSTPGIAPVPQVEIATSRAQDGAWSEAVERLRALGHGDECGELSRAQVQGICRSPVFRGGGDPAHRGDRAAGAAGVRAARRAARARRADPRGHRGRSKSARPARRRARPRARARLRATRAPAILAAGWRTLRWPGSRAS